MQLYRWACTQADLQKGDPHESFLREKPRSEQWMGIRFGGQWNTSQAFDGVAPRKRKQHVRNYALQ